MIGAIFDLLTPIHEHEATRQGIAALDAAAEIQRCAFEEQCRAHAAADPSVIDVEARVIEDVPTLPAPTEGAMP